MNRQRFWHSFWQGVIIGACAVVAYEIVLKVVTGG